MVDAINSINVATRSVAQERKDYTIDWKKLTASQVLEYADKGEDIPVAILKWAEDYAKLTNVPDDVSYEAVNGSTDADDARAVEKSEKEGEEEAAADENPEEDNKENAELSPYEQAGILIQESNVSRNTVNNATMDGVVKIAEEKVVGANSALVERLTQAEARSKKNEYDELLKKISSDKKNITPDDLKKLDVIYNQLTDIGNRSQSVLTSYDEQLNEIETVFSQYDLLPPPGYSKADETMDIGKLLIKIANEDDENFNILYYIRGMMAFASGGALSGASLLGENVFLAGHELNAESVEKVVESMEKVEEITMVKGSRATADESEEDEVAPEDVSPTENNDPETKTESENEASSSNKTDDKGIKDSTILVDDIEIKRRKENRGEKPAES